MKTNRIIIYAKDVQRITGKSEKAEVSRCRDDRTTPTTQVSIETKKP